MFVNITKNDVIWHIPTVQMLGRELSVPLARPVDTVKQPESLI